MGRLDDARAQLRAALAAPVRERLDVVEQGEARRLLEELE
jgi:hypothetical protein